jgi:hypothetical protein
MARIISTVSADVDEDSRRATDATDHTGKILLFEAVLLHVELDGLKWVWRQDRPVLVLINRNEDGQDLDFVVLWRPRLSVPKRLNEGKRGLMIGLSVDGPDVHRRLLELRNCRGIKAVSHKESVSA